ncbi:MAG: glycosyltransferase [Candidatus Omnitrophota bacterium]
MPKIGILTNRSDTSYVFMHSVYDFEDCIVKATGGELVYVPPRKYDLVNKCKRKVKLDGVRLKDSYDVLFCVSLNFGTALEDVLNWRDRCKYCICYIYDTWPNITKYDEAAIRRTLKHVDLLCFSFPESISYFKILLNPLPFWVPQAINPDRFYYVPKLDRGVGVYMFGRQPQGVFEKVKSYCMSRNFLMMQHNRLPFPEGKVLDWEDAYTMHAQLLLHAKVTLNWTMQLTHPSRIISSTTTRWFEPAATGCLVIGNEPSDGEFQKLFPIPGFVRKVDNDFGNLTALIEEAIQDKDSEDLRRQLAEHTRNHHTWYHRIARMLNRAKLSHLLKSEYQKYLTEDGLGNIAGPQD